MGFFAAFHAKIFLAHPRADWNFWAPEPWATRQGQEPAFLVLLNSSFYHAAWGLHMREIKTRPLPQN